MATRQKTVEYAFNVDNTALATATRRDLAAITLYLPETTTRTFKSVIVEVNARANSTANFTATLIGIKLGAVAFSDVTQTVTWTATADHYAVQMLRDVTSYFTTNFGAGASQTCQVGVTFTGEVTIAHSVKIYITYEYDTADNTRVKTVRIPLDSPTAQLTATLASIGTSQIPALDTFLPETTKVYRAIWLEFQYNDASTAVTDVNLEVALDAEAGVDICFCEQAASTGVFNKTFWRRDDMTTNATHDLKARSDNTANRFTLLTVILHVTYEYSLSASSAFIKSLVLPLDSLKQAWDSAAGDETRIWKEVWIEEPATIAMVQSGIVMHLAATSTLNVTIQVGAQSAGRTYVLTAGTVDAGPRPFCHRIDSGGAGGASQTLVRGKNVIEIDFFKNATGGGVCLTGCLYLNYTHGDMSDDGDGNMSSPWLLFGSNDTFTTTREGTQAQTVSLPNATYFVNGVGVEARVMGNFTAASILLGLEQASGENEGAGYVNALAECHLASDAEFGEFPMWGDVSLHYDRWAGDPKARMDPEVARNVLMATQTTNAAMTAMMWVTHHEMTWSIAGNITGSAGGTVNIAAYRTDTGEKIASTSRTGNGAYSMTWYDSTVTCYVDAYEDGTHVGRSADGVLA